MELIKYGVPLGKINELQSLQRHRRQKKIEKMAMANNILIFDIKALQFHEGFPDGQTVYIQNVRVQASPVLIEQEAVVDFIKIEDNTLICRLFLTIEHSINLKCHGSNFEIQVQRKASVPGQAAVTYHNLLLIPGQNQAEVMNSFYSLLNCRSLKTLGDIWPLNPAGLLQQIPSGSSSSDSESGNNSSVSVSLEDVSVVNN